MVLWSLSMTGIQDCQGHRARVVVRVKVARHVAFQRSNDHREKRLLILRNCVRCHHFQYQNVLLHPRLSSFPVCLSSRRPLVAHSLYCPLLTPLVVPVNVSTTARVVKGSTPTCIPSAAHSRSSPDRRLALCRNSRRAGIVGWMAEIREE